MHKLDDQDFNSAVILVVLALNMTGGSIAGSINLYQLLQAYLGVPECRDQMNDVVADALALRRKKKR